MAVERGMEGDVCVYTKLSAPNANDPDQTTDVRMGNVLSVFELARMSEKEALRIIERFLHNMETHELREFFKVDGICVTDPHPELKHQDRLRESLDNVSQGYRDHANA